MSREIRLPRPHFRNRFLTSEDFTTMYAAVPAVASLFLSLSVATSAPEGNAIWPENLPDPCTYEYDSGPLTVASGQVRYPSAYEGVENTLPAVVFIVNGNGFNEQSYIRLAEHLARQNLLVQTIVRPNATEAVFDVEAEMAATFERFGLPDDFPVVLIGHSVGGGSVMEVTRQFGYDIEAVITIAPNTEDVIGYLGTESSAYLTLYGSQDEDMHGTSGPPREAFAGYDLVNLESTTASPANRYLVITPNVVDKAMVYVRGADHSGFLGPPVVASSGSYLRPSDQFCISKAYITGFLEWTLFGNDEYRPLFYGDEVPPSVAAMTTAEPDNFGNPAGAPVQLFHQFSPLKRFVIADFGATPTMTVGASVYASRIYPYAEDSHARHESSTLRLAWSSNAMYRNVEITVPSDRRNLAAFDRLQLRIGQIDTGVPRVANTPQQEPTLILSLVDSEGRRANVHLNTYGSIPGPDMRSGGTRGHSHMNTIAIPMDDLDSINLQDVRYVRFWVTPNTQGEVMIDNIEAVYDY